MKKFMIMLILCVVLSGCNSEQPIRLSNAVTDRIRMEAIGKKKSEAFALERKKEINKKQEMIEYTIERETKRIKEREEVKQREVERLEEKVKRERYIQNRTAKDILRVKVEKEMKRIKAKKEAKRKASKLLEIWEQSGIVKIGMTVNDVRNIKGQPDHKNVSVGRWGTHEQWVYGDSYYYFENGIMTSYSY